MDESKNRRVLGFFFVGGVLVVGGLAGAWRASQYGAPLWRVVVACVSVGLGWSCVIGGLVSRRREP